jgi:hypothetical protein
MNDYSFIAKNNGLAYIVLLSRGCAPGVAGFVEACNNPTQVLMDMFSAE